MFYGAILVKHTHVVTTEFLLIQGFIAGPRKAADRGDNSVRVEHNRHLS